MQKKGKKRLMCRQNDVLGLSRSAPGPAPAPDEKTTKNDKNMWKHVKQMQKKQKMTAQNRNDKSMHNQMTKT